MGLVYAARTSWHLPAAQVLRVIQMTRLKHNQGEQGQPAALPSRIEWVLEEGKREEVAPSLPNHLLQPGGGVVLGNICQT
mmetsp:Transcript_50776/g.120670  ORF Transcript_50776/g.120670 Transcript_50776/m.120670 type:complete len:80 (+) Transcript_50776:308-547(+)